MEEPQVILVNDQDQVVGSMGKQAAHEEGVLHRAISVLLFNQRGEWLIHQRNPKKISLWWTLDQYLLFTSSSRGRIASCCKKKIERRNGNRS